MSGRDATPAPLELPLARRREILWHLEINDKHLVENVLKHYSNVLAESWRPLEKDSSGQREFSKSAGGAWTQVTGG